MRAGPGSVGAWLSACLCLLALGGCAQAPGLPEVPREPLVAVRYPIAVSDSTALAREKQRDLANRQTPLDRPLPFPRDVSAFPGEVAEWVPRVSAEFQLDRRVRKLSHPGWTPGWRQTLHTGLWAPAGAVIRIEVSGTAELVRGVYARIGTHSDVLRTDGQPINNEKQLRRFASVSTTQPLQAGVTELRSQYGGFLVIESPEYADGTLGLRISGAIAGAYFDTSRHSVADWPAIRARPSPWVTIEGRRAVITVPKDQVASLDDPIALMAHYDKHVERHEWLAGLDGEGAAHPLQAPLKQHLMWDPQITAGYAHAGYPIMATSTWRLAVPEKARTDWGNVHEIGHNYQQFALWCTAFGSESTVNLFSLHALEQEGVTSRLVEKSLYKAAVDKLEAGRIKSFADDADVWDKLVFMMQLKAAFPEQGWSLFRQLFRAYRELPEAEQRAIIASKQLQYDKNFELLSRLSGHNLESHYLHWGVPLSETARARVRALNLPEPAQPTWRLISER